MTLRRRHAYAGCTASLRRRGQATTLAAVRGPVASRRRARYRVGMRYGPLGSTGMQVSTYCLGAMMYGAMGNPDREDCVKAINIALDAGVNFIDTADVY